MSSIQTQQSVAGFVASEPQLSYTERGDARLYMKIGIEHYRREEDVPHIYVPQDRFYHIVSTQNKRVLELKHFGV